MVLNLVEPLSEDVIKVTIKDKPGPRKLPPEEQLRSAFEVLRVYALQERRVRQLRGLLEQRGSQRRLKRCFATWRELAGASAAKTETVDKPSSKRITSEARIELLVSAIAERQRALVQAAEAPISVPGIKQPQQSGVPPKPGRSANIQQQQQQQQQQQPQRLRISSVTEKRLRLAEQRRRQLEEEAKLRELDRAARQTSRRTIEVARQALDKCDQRTRRGIIHLMREQGCRDESLTEIPRIPSPPRFLMRMEARAEARKERMKLTDDIRKRRRDEQKKRDEANRLRVEEEQRQEQIKAQKEALKFRREQELKRLKEIERNKRLEELADHCYNRYLFHRYILEPLSDIVDEKRQVLNFARKHYEETLLRKVFAAWKNEWTEQLQAKLQLAEKLYRHNLLWYNFDEWRALALRARQKHQVAVDFYDMNLQKKTFRGWRSLCAKLSIVAHDQEVKAKKHYEKHLKKLCFNIWKRYMAIASEINESERRRDEWRDLIKKFIPETPVVKKRVFYY